MVQVGMTVSMVKYWWYNSMKSRLAAGSDNRMMMFTMKQQSVIKVQKVTWQCHEQSQSSFGGPNETIVAQEYGMESTTATVILPCMLSCPCDFVPHLIMETVKPPPSISYSLPLSAPSCFKFPLLYYSVLSFSPWSVQILPKFLHPALQSQFGTEL